MRIAILTVACALALAGLLLYASTPATADDPRPRPTITATVTLPGAHSGSGEGDDDDADGSPSEPPPCVVASAPGTGSIAPTLDIAEVNIGSILGQRPRFRYYSENGNLHRYNSATNRFERLMHKVCGDPNDPEHERIVWQTVAAPDPAILIPEASRTATEQIQLPVPEISPTGDVAVNLGMWLAVEQAGPYVARAEFNDAVWAETTATLGTTTFDLGDGTPPIVCEGRGTPIPDPNLDSTEPGPCGHVYTELSDIGPHSMTITSTWHITWSLSNGATGNLADVAASTQHDYAVYEIQTVGVSG